MLLYRILISITVILVVFWIWNYVTNVYTAVFVCAGLVFGVGAYLLLLSVFSAMCFIEWFQGPGRLGCFRLGSGMVPWRHSLLVWFCLWGSRLMLGVSLP